ncbi:hypothetical protein TREES_T100012850 [Tupaia chinensis]|uniref:Uncharacterized protein n=1 Tax=Tupaia chinensis TaxID=246437 RepID=L9LB96_TUPCH|nr:hypothetical protein TREES_T100012850 [Tupaia chinensis]
MPCLFIPSSCGSSEAVTTLVLSLLHGSLTPAAVGSTSAGLGACTAGQDPVTPSHLREQCCRGTEGREGVSKVDWQCHQPATVCPTDFLKGWFQKQRPGLVLAVKDIQQLGVNDFCSTRECSFSQMDNYHKVGKHPVLERCRCGSKFFKHMPKKLLDSLGGCFNKLRIAQLCNRTDSAPPKNGGKGDLSCASWRREEPSSLRPVSSLQTLGGVREEGAEGVCLPVFSFQLSLQSSGGHGPVIPAESGAPPSGQAVLLPWNVLSVPTDPWSFGLQAADSQLELEVISTSLPRPAAELVNRLEEEPKKAQLWSPSHKSSYCFMESGQQGSQPQVSVLKQAQEAQDMPVPSALAKGAATQQASTACSWEIIFREQKSKQTADSGVWASRLQLEGQGLRDKS